MFAQPRQLPAAPGVEQGLARSLAGARETPKSCWQPEKMRAVWFREVKTRLVSLAQDSGLARDLSQSMETVEHRAPILEDAQLFLGGGGHDQVVRGWCRGELGELGEQKQEILRA